MNAPAHPSSARSRVSTACWALAALWVPVMVVFYLSNEQWMARHLRLLIRLELWAHLPADKPLHLAGFGVLGTLIALALTLRPQPARLKTGLAWLLAMALFGLVLELLQHFSPGRTVDPTDLLANVIGATLGLGLTSWVALKLRPRLPSLPDGDPAE